jgi:AraC-like DNA-binding protein
MPEPLEMPDIAFLFEPPRDNPLPDGDVSIPRSRFICRIPPPSLSGFVDLFWFYRCDASVRVRERVLPTGTMGLVIDLRDDSPGPSVFGAHSETFAVEPAHEALSVGVRFKPGGAFPFLDLSAGELHNTHIPLERLWGSRADALHERLLEAKSSTAMFDILEQAMLEQAIRPLARHPAVAFALGEFQARPHAPTIGDVIRHVGLSPRTFIRHFTEQVGLTPKLFCRIRRFQAALRLVRKGRRRAWPDVALDCGYYDQAHFIRDFRAFSGVTPTAFLRVWGEHLDYGARWTRSLFSKTSCSDFAQMRSGHPRQV